LPAAQLHRRGRNRQPHRRSLQGLPPGLPRLNTRCTAGPRCGGIAGAFTAPILRCGQRDRSRHAPEETPMKTRLLAACAIVATVLAAGCASTSPGYSGGYGYGSAPQGTRCMDCGTVVAIEEMGRTGGMVAGSWLGGNVGVVAARELARRNAEGAGRRNVAIAAGAAGGAIAGNAIQNRTSGW